MGNESRKTCKFKVGKRDIGSRSPSGSAGIFLGLSFGNQERQWKILTPNFHHVSYIPSKTKLRWVRGFPMCDYLYPEVPKVSHDSHSTTHVWSFKSHWITQIHRRKFDPRLRIRAIRQDGILPGLVVTVKSQGLKMGFFFPTPPANFDLPSGDPTGCTVANWKMAHWNSWFTFFWDGDFP